MNVLTTWVIMMAVTLVDLASSEDLVVNTCLGRVRGHYSISRDGREFIQFLGIPYAKPPTGKLRFKSPVSPDPWKHEFDATKECSECIQQLNLMEDITTNVTGKEDCLCLNVFTPCISTPHKLPVIVFIHGGAYLGGSSATVLYGPDLLMDRDVVLVTLNFRTGVMGFLALGNHVIPGNYALKDQSFALKWVQENILNFGGDPGSVTLFGESSGATSVSLHQYSPLSKGLFHRAIQNSGGVLDPWAFQPLEVVKGRSSAVVDMVGCSNSDPNAVLQCLQALPAETIVNTTHTFADEDFPSLSIWTPTVEPCRTDGAFLTIDPRTITESASYPLLMGLNSAEGGLFSISIVGRNAQRKIARWNDEYDTITPIIMLYNGTELDHPWITKAMREFYFGSQSELITPEMLQEITRIFGDNWFNIGILNEAEKRSGPTYLYYYNYNKTVSICPLWTLGSSTPNVGACHFDDLMNFFPLQGTAPVKNTSDADYLLSVKLLDMWTNFAKTSNPSTYEITWEPVSTAALEHLEISNSGISMKINPLQERREFWKRLGCTKCFRSPIKFFCFSSFN